MTCEIRKWKLSDAKDLAAVLSNTKIQDNLRDGIPYPYTEQDGADFISAMLSADENETFAFAITIDGKVIGSIGIFRQGNIHRQTAELGYWIAETCWGKGFMTAAVRQICKYVFDKSDIIRIYAEPFAFNAASCRVLEKAGFQYEGTLRNNAVKNGNVVDMKLYSLLKSDFEGSVVMSKGKEIYKNFIDDLVKMSRSCVSADNVKTANVRGIDAKTGINDILNKLNEQERRILAEYILGTYHSGIYDTLEQLEWLRTCKEMVIIVDGEVLPTGMYEGIPCDYIGRHQGWEWPE